MLVYKNGRLYDEGISFPMPDDFYINYDCGATSESGVTFINRDETIVVDWCVNDKNECDETVLNEIIENGGFQYITNVASLEINNFTGCYALYKNNTAEYFELRIDIGNDKELTFVIEAFNGISIKDILDTSFYRSLIEGIRKE